SLPSSLSTKVDSKKGLGTISGIFFMALTLVIVSFSCTGPILGTLLVGSLNGGAWQLTAGLAGFGLSLALPFALFSTFPNLLQSLPKSGSWMDSLKKILAFIELALALKFLSNADLVRHWGLLKRETFIIIWIAILIALILYLIGKIKLPHEYVKKIPIWRKIIAIFVSIFTIYLLGGLFNFNKLSLLSGFPPPTNYSYQYKNIENKNQLHIINNYDSAIILAKQTHKFILLDFTGWACVNCRKMEENVWTNDKIAKLLAQNFIILSLYVDDKNDLPNNQQFIYTKKDGSQQTILTVGDKWTLFEAENFKQVSQPLYAIINENEDLLNAPISFTPNINTYFNWLNCGINVNK
ncbi:MAG: thioredoxin family protein, partial [Sediminibacterium sp.]|nr:thioredoxin family protein [Sediminibacterium sp.]